MRGKVTETFRQLAADSARRLEATGNPVMPDFEDAVVKEVMATLPSPTLLQARLSLRYGVGVMQLGSEMIGEQRKAAEERRQLESIEAERRLEEHRQHAQERIVQEGLWADQERLPPHLAGHESEPRQEAADKQRL